MTFSRTPTIRRTNLLQAVLVVWSCFATLAVKAWSAETFEVDATVQSMLEERCVECHNADLKNGGVDLAALSSDFNPASDVDRWVKVESAIISEIMPPPDEDRLTTAQIASFSKWFDRQFVMPGGVQHAGPLQPRRLTREELQNTLEDILHVDIRKTVTNSRLHVIPDTIIEKFFADGVRGENGFSNDATTLGKESIDIQTYARCFSLVLSLLDSNKKAREQLFGNSVLSAETSGQDARQIIDRFGRSAFRRDLTKDELEAFFVVYKKMVKSRPSYDALKSSFLAFLLSPPFLYRFEELPDARTTVVGNELAVRLSYFLWSAPPDETLLSLAAKRVLHKPEVLKQQVARMLADPKRVALAENLGGEWFDFKQLRQQSAVNKRSDKMAGFYRTQYEEALLFFDSMIRYNQPIHRFVDADWAFLNRHQTNIYRISTEDKDFQITDSLPPINIHYRDGSRQMRRLNYEYKHEPLKAVKLSDSNLGGFVTAGPTMSVTSTANRTSPIRRGVWVLERILGKHFEVPEDVPDLETTQKKAKNEGQSLTHNELLKLHSSQEGCASCHRYIDPIGFGLEIYDQLGISRADSEPNSEGEKLNWTAEQTPDSYTDRSWNLAEPLAPGSRVRVFFQYTAGHHRLDVRRVRLVSGDVQLIDKHFGFAGEPSRNNVWFFNIPDDAKATEWELIAEVRGNGGTDSNGVINVSGPSPARTHVLPNGNSFSSPRELKELLLSDYHDQITENIIRQVLAYALGRKILPIDRPAIQQIKNKLESDDYRMSTLIEAVVLSYPFRFKQPSLIYSKQNPNKAIEKQ